PWLIQFREVMPVAGPNWTALQGELRASKGGGVVVLKPQSRFFPSPPTTTNEAAIDTSWNGQLYAVLGEPDGQGRWQLRLWWKPFVTLIWAGGALVALGGFLSLIGRLRRERRPRRDIPAPAAVAAAARHPVGTDRPERSRFRSGAGSRRPPRPGERRSAPGPAASRQRLRQLVP